MMHFNNRLSILTRTLVVFTALLFCFTAYAKFIPLKVSKDIAAKDVNGAQYLKYKIENLNKKKISLNIDGLISPLERDSAIDKNCQDTLAPGSYCYVGLKIKPDTKITNISQKLNISYACGENTEQKCEKPIVIQIPVEPKITKLTSHTEDMYLVYEIENLNNKNISLDKFNIFSNSVKNAAIKITNDCGNSLAAGKSCRIELKSALYSDFENSSLKFAWSHNKRKQSTVEIPIELDRFALELKEPTNIIKEMQVIGTTNLGDEQVLNYSLHNTGTVAASEINISGYSQPITRDNAVENNCGTSLASGGTCNIKLLVKPNRAGKITQTLKITAQDSQHHKDWEKTSLIETEAKYTPFMLIKKTDIPKEIIPAGKDFNFTMPIAIHTIDENVDTSAVFVGTTVGLLKKQEDSAGNANWEFTDNNLPHTYPYIEDLHTVGNCIHAIFINNKDTTTEEKSYISNSCDEGLSWDPKDSYKEMRGIRKVQGKVLVAALDWVFILSESQVKLVSLGDLERAKFYDYTSNATSQEPLSRNFLTFKVHGEEDNICVATNKGFFINNDFDGNSGKKWRKYHKGTLGFADSNNVKAAHCDRDNFYAGTDKGMSISSNNGSSWRTTLDKYEIHGIYAKDGMVWVATKNELFYSKDNGVTWTSESLSVGEYTMLFFAVPLKTPELVQDTLTLFKKSNKEYIEFVMKESRGNRIVLGLPRYGGGISCEMIKNAYFKLVKKCYTNHNETINGDRAKNARGVLWNVKSILEEKTCGIEPKPWSERDKPLKSDIEKEVVIIDDSREDLDQSNKAKIERELSGTPQILSTKPANASKNVTPDERITILFSRSMEQTTLNTNTVFMMKAVDGTEIPGSMGDGLSDLAVFIPKVGSMLPFTKYIVIVTKGVRNLSGTSMIAEYSWFFTTGA